jgi:hypothetical protein
VQIDAALLSSKRIQHTPHLRHKFDTQQQQQQQQQQLSSRYRLMLPSSAASASNTRRTCNKEGRIIISSSSSSEKAEWVAMLLASAAKCLQHTPHLRHNAAAAAGEQHVQFDAALFSSSIRWASSARYCSNLSAAAPHMPSGQQLAAQSACH